MLGKFPPRLDGEEPGKTLMPRPRLLFGGGSIGRPSFGNVPSIDQLLAYLASET